MEEQLERIYTIPLTAVKDSPRNHRADRAIRAVRKYLVHHMKAEEVWIDAAVNEKLWNRGMYRIPSRIRVRARLFDDGVVEVSLPEEESKAGSSIRESLQDAKEQKLEEVHKKESEAIEKAMSEGAATPSGASKAKESETTDEEKPAAKAAAPKPTPEAKAEEPKPAAKKAATKAPAKDE
jgi:large subunit ribosomal protein L31e